MLGYVQGDSLAWWATSLRKPQVENTATNCMVLEETEHKWKTAYERPNLNPIDINHILLDCRH